MGDAIADRVYTPARVWYKHRRVDGLERRDLLLLTPVMPAGGGNGLAMRAGAQLQALAGCYDVCVVVVPVAGGPLDDTWARQHATTVSVVAPGDPAELRAGAARLVGDARWRARLARAEPMPHPVAYGSPVLAGAVHQASGIEGARVHALRAYLAPLAVAVAEQASAPWATLDLDDDDQQLLASEGRTHEADAYGRLLETFGPAFRWLSLASPEDAARVARRHGLATTALPNSVVVPSTPPGRSRRQSGRRSLLLVGNLAYAPNVEAAEVLVSDILPGVRSLTGEIVVVDLVGRFEPGGPVEVLADCEGVTAHGHVDDLDAAYARADVAVVPLARGSGTRIKLLEALAAGVPVVTTGVGAAGLEVEGGRHLLLADGAADVAAAVASVLRDERLAASLVRAGRALVQQRYSSAVVARQLQSLTTALDRDASGDEAARSQI